MPHHPPQFGLGRIFAIMAGAAIIAALPAVVGLFVLLGVCYVACASGWVIDVAMAAGRAIFQQNGSFDR